MKRYSRAQGYVLQNKFYDAIEEYKDYLEKEPKDRANIWYEIAQVYHVYLKNYEKAIEAYRMAVAYGYGKEIAASSLDQIANIYFEEKKERGNAIKSYKQLVDEYPDSPLADRAIKMIEMLRNGNKN